MARAIVDPSEMRRFAAFLDSERERLHDQRMNMRMEFARLQDVWKDEKYARFEQTYEEAERALQQYLSYCETYSTFLKQKAARAQKYLDQR